jgi:membrane protease YdiL (CAAX protease family)
VKTGALVILTLGLVGVTTLAAPLVAAGLALAGGSFHFARVYDRVFEILLVGALAVTWRRLDLGGPQAWGLRDRRWPRHLVVGMTAGMLGVAAALGLAWAGGALVPALRFAPLKTVGKAALGMLAAIVLGLGEETLFRGIVLRRARADLGARGGVVATSAIYAVVHALRGEAVAGSGIAAGLARTFGLFAPLGDATVWPGVVGLFGLGLVLAMARTRTGTLWVPIGIHATWVAVFRVGRLFFDVRQRPAWLVGPGWPPLVGGVAGLVALVVTAGVLRVVLARRQAEPEMAV